MFFFKRFALSFQPVKGYGQLMNANGLGAFGAFVVIIAISCLVSMAGDRMVFNKVAPVASSIAKDLPSFTVTEGKLNMPNVKIPLVKQYDNAVVVIDPNGKSITRDMVKKYNRPWYIMVTSDGINVRAAQSNRYAFISFAVLNGMNNKNAHECLSKMVVTTASVMYVVISLLSIVGRGGLALLVAGILSLIKFEGTTPIYSNVLKIVTHAMIPATVLQMIVNMVYALQFSVTRSTDISGLSMVAFFICTLALSIAALYKVKPEVQQA